MVALKHLTPGAAIWYKDSTGATVAADVVIRNDALKSWGIIKVKVVRHRDQIPVWIDRKQITSLCD